MSEKLFCLIAILSVVCLGCTGPDRVYAPKIDASAAGEAAIEQYDTNQDGTIAGEELNACPALLAALQRVDTDGDRAISAEEITARIEKWQASKTGLAGAQCKVKFRERPLANAKVVFEPEAFLGENLKVGEGVTNSNGLVSLKQVDNDKPGMPLGFYKVKITSDSIPIPANYNENTMLGIEVFVDSPERDSEITFNLR